jgi:hypothetical protein
MRKGRYISGQFSTKQIVILLNVASGASRVYILAIGQFFHIQKNYCLPVHAKLAAGFNIEGV